MNVSEYLNHDFLTLGGYLNAQFSILQNLELLARLITAAVCGACIGVERTRRLKEAGMRTHVVVCCTAALMMVVSKYAFADLTSMTGAAFHGTRGADPARVAAQVVSGVSFLGAGAIFKSGNTIKGLTTAAGIWATAGVGLAVGAGMYFQGIAFSVLLILLQFMMHQFVAGREMISHELTFTIRPEEHFREAFDAFLENRHIQVTDSQVSYTNEGVTTYHLMVKCPHGVIQEVDDFLHAHGKVHSVSYSNIT